MTETPKDVLTRWFVSLWRNREPIVIERTRTEGSTSRGLAASPIVGVNAFQAFYDRMSAIITETDIRFDWIVEQGDTVAAHVTLTGKVRGQPIEVAAAVFGRIVEGRLLESRNLVDVAGFVRQLGHDVPRDLTEALALVEADAQAGASA
jgi:hypothetical protein